MCTRTLARESDRKTCKKNERSSVKTFAEYGSILLLKQFTRTQLRRCCMHSTESTCICVQVDRHYCRRCLRVHTSATLVWFWLCHFGRLQFAARFILDSLSFSFSVFGLYILLTCRWSNWSHFISENAVCVGVGSKHTHSTRTVPSIFLFFNFVTRFLVFFFLIKHLMHFTIFVVEDCAFLFSAFCTNAIHLLHFRSK